MKVQWIFNTFWSLRNTHDDISRADGLPQKLWMYYAIRQHYDFQDSINYTHQTLADTNSEGAEIMSVYARVCILSSNDNFNIFVLSIQWIGLSTSDLNDSELKQPELSFSTLIKSDMKTVVMFPIMIYQINGIIGFITWRISKRRRHLRSLAIWYSLFC